MQLSVNPQSAIRNPQSSVEDGALVARAQAGDRAAFDQLVLRHQDRIYNAVTRFLRDRDAALDVAQKAFLNAFLHLKDFEAKAAFGTWLYRIAMNLAISEARRRKGAVSLSQAGGDREEGTDFDPPAPADPPTRGLEARETQEAVQAAIRKLDEDHRAVVVLCDIEGRPYEEIAEILGIPKGTVRSRLHRARCELRAMLGKVL